MQHDTPSTLPMGASAYSGLFQSVAGLRNVRAFTAMTGCAVVGVIVAGLLVAMGSRLGAITGLLAALVWFVAIGTGINAAGLLHMDTARGISPRSLVDAISQGLMCVPKLIVLAIAVLLVEILVFAVIAVLLFICKIPFLGPVLFTFVFPASVVVAGVTVFGLFLGVTLSVPAIWQGATISRALAQTFAILRGRLVEAVLLLLVVAFLSFAVGAVVFGVLGAGLMPTIGMSAAIVGFGGFGGGMSSGMGSVMGMTTGGGHAIAGTIGGLVLWAIAVSLVAQVYLLGLCLVYLRVTEGLDFSAAEATLRGRLDDARRRAGELGEKARAAARSDAPATTPAPMESTDTTRAAAGGLAAAADAGGFRLAPDPAPAPLTPGGAASAPVDAFGTSPLSSAAAKRAADIDLPFGPSTIASPQPTAAPGDEPTIAMPAPPFEPPAAIENCPQCRAPISADDVFCGVCGYRLR